MYPVITVTSVAVKKKIITFVKSIIRGLSLITNSRNNINKFMKF